jgi:hypothetical protein
MPDYNHEKWYELYRSALMEFEHSLMAGRIKTARVEILSRVEELRNIPGLYAEERQALEDAMSGLRSLERDEAEYIEREAHAALHKLRSLDPGLQRLKFDPSGD